MVLSKGILLKGLLGLGTLVGATTLGVVYREEISNLFTGNGGDMAVGGEGAQVDAGSRAAASSGSGGQVAETPSVTSDSQGSKGEASGKAAGAGGETGSAIRKERVEVTVDSFKEEIKKVGIKDDCQINDLEGEKTCSTFNKDNLKNLMFPFKEEDEELVIVGTDDNNDNIKISLKVKKANDLDIFTSGTKYTIEITGESITIKKQGDTSGKNEILLMEGTNPEFTVKDGKLVRAWDAIKLGKKVGLTCKVNENVCSITNEIKVIKDGKVQSIDTTKASKKEISFSEETANYNQGFKFTVPEGGIKGTDDSVILDAGKYEIKYQEGKERG